MQTQSFSLEIFQKYNLCYQQVWIYEGIFYAWHSLFGLWTIFITLLFFLISIIIYLFNLIFYVKQANENELYTNQT